jgi:hypothetical protein
LLTETLRDPDFLTAVGAWSLLLATRDEEVIRVALAHGPDLHRRATSLGADNTYERWLHAYLHDEGLAREQGAVRFLHGESPRCLRFPDGYLAAERSVFHGRFHPTWHDLSDLSPAMRFGGEGASKCGSCKQKLHHLITLDPVPADLGVSLPRLTLGACLSCLGWEPGGCHLYYDHGPRGQPRCRRKGAAITPRFPAGPLRETEVRLGRPHPRWTWMGWGSGIERNLHRVGGPPSWVQSGDYPECPRCDRAMAFLMQLDSNLPTADDGREWLWGSGGMGYGFWCDRCLVSGWFWQCT